MNNPENAIILLSGGLDSIVALDCVQKNKLASVRLALTFDYGQKAVDKEITSSKMICRYYNIEHKVIKLDWLGDITNTALVSDDELPEESFGTIENAKSVWVPNRNALFLNIAGCYCDALDCKYIIYGANRDEARTFPDNTEAFRRQITKMFESSTLVKPKVLTPLINYGKDDIVRIAVDNSVPLELIWSCYKSGSCHCGKCESCNHLKKALIANHCEKYLKLFFKDED